MERSLAQASKQIAEQVKEATLPEDLLQLIKDELDADPALSWDMAVASIIRNDR